jgi:Ca-activated chloride channel family protein
MEATDVQPSRLERAKLKLRDMLELRKGAATGLIVYSGSAHLVMPLTLDSRIITSMIEDLTPDLMPAEGDALAAAITLASRMLERAGVPGSMLVMADSVSPSQAEALKALEGVPVQFHAVQSPGAPPDVGMKRAAGALGASITQLTVDGTDAERIVRRAKTRIASAAAEKTGARKKDSGRAIVPLIALVALMWSRKGWVVR